MNQQQESGNETEPAEREHDRPYQDGFNMKAVLRGPFVGFIMLSGAIYRALVAGIEVSVQTAGQ